MNIFFANKNESPVNPRTKVRGMLGVLQKTEVPKVDILWDDAECKRLVHTMNKPQKDTKLGKFNFEAMKAQAADMDRRHKEMLAAVDLAIKTHTANMQVAADKGKFIQETMHKEVDHRQKVTHQERMAAVKQKQASQKPPSKGK